MTQLDGNKTIKSQQGITSLSTERITRLPDYNGDISTTSFIPISNDEINAGPGFVFADEFNEPSFDNHFVGPAWASVDPPAPNLFSTIKTFSGTTYPMPVLPHGKLSTQPPANTIPQGWLQTIERPLAPGYRLRIMQFVDQIFKLEVVDLENKVVEFLEIEGLTDLELGMRVTRAKYNPDLTELGTIVEAVFGE